MIPSDHFTRFYNEVFKFLENQGEDALADYFLEISKNQEKHILDLIREEGFAGMYQYWSVIRDEENCELDLGYDDEKIRAQDAPVPEPHQGQGQRRRALQAILRPLRRLDRADHGQDRLPPRLRRDRTATGPSACCASSRTPARHGKPRRTRSF